MLDRFRLAAERYSIIVDFISKNNRYLFIIIFLIIFYAVILRCSGLFFPQPSFSVDESAVAGDLSDVGKLSDYLDRKIARYSRPIGYLILNKFLITNINNSEIVFRSTSLLPGCMFVFVLLLISRLSFSSLSAQIVALYLGAFNSWAIFFSKEFKQYSMELFLNSFLFYLAVLYLLKNNRIALYLLFIFTPISIFFGNSIIPALPSIYLFLYIIFLQKKSYKNIIYTTISLLCSISTLFGLYKLFWSQTAEYFSSNMADLGEMLPKDINFYSKFLWFGKKKIEIIKELVLPKSFFLLNNQALNVCSLLILLVIIFGIVNYLKKNRYLLLLLSILPIFTIMCLTIIGKWPYSPARYSLFMILYFIILFSIGIDSILENAKYVHKDKIVLVGLGVFAFLFFPFDHEYYFHRQPKYQTVNEEFKKSIGDIIQINEFYKGAGLYKPEKERQLYFNTAGYTYFYDYYMNHHHIFKGYKKYFNDNFLVNFYSGRESDTMTRETLNAVRNDGYKWFTFTHYKPSEYGAFSETAVKNMFTLFEAKHNRSFAMFGMNEDIIPVFNQGDVFEIEDSAVRVYNDSSYDKADKNPSISGVALSNCDYYFKIKASSDCEIVLKLKMVMEDSDSDSIIIEINKNEKIKQTFKSKGRMFAEYSSSKFAISEGENLIGVMKSRHIVIDQITIENV